jgi:mycothiol synthase
MITIRRADTDADLEAWREVRMAVLPNERAATVEEMKRTQTPDRLVLLAERDGDLVGSGYADRSSVADSAAVAPRVRPEIRRCGVGTALLRPLADHAATLGVGNILALVDDEGSAAFARRFGFEEADRQVEQVKTLGAEREPRFPEGVEVATIAERPKLLEEAYRLAVEGYADMATFAPVSVTLEEWLREEATHPTGSFVALADGDVVGYSGLMRDADRADRAEDGLTTVRRDWRRRGLGTALKRAELAWAAANGIREIYTWTQQGNEAMRRLNEQLGYEYRGVAVTMVARLPLS